LSAERKQLGDFVNAMTPFLQPNEDPPSEDFIGFAGSDLEAQGLPTFDELLKVWCDYSGTHYPPKNLSWVIAWQWFRVRGALELAERSR
jgi:hypothetical protein